MRREYQEDHAVFDDYTGVVLDLDEGDRLAQTLGDRKAVILRNHGLLTVGHSVDEAAWWFITMERSCQAQLMAEAAGTPILIRPEIAQLTYTQVGTHYMGWFSFQSLYDMIVRQQPDLLE
ncbi:class II aldolase/adducin family protein [Phormidium sp. CCY1219]|uniref:class II aldolase/adducin family protein n=1 Tax=Phormidium sp. CCY1219 TaxID=2886104 RepID=UPI002D792FE5|nr:class II aldolase/adducin family protein [Phormidium sp. CCY1219]